ncbi:hypothetical protein HY992_01100 [Candidatus Micrarchaeota archaeon]|nr:hypothetical protein [Candidatus Micrarchaeota archaeon]
MACLQQLQSVREVDPSFMPFDEIERRLRADFDKLSKQKNTRQVEHADKLLMCELAIDHLNAYKESAEELERLVACYKRASASSKQHSATLKRRVAAYKRALSLLNIALNVHFSRRQKLRAQKKRIRLQLSACSESIAQFKNAVRGISFSLKKRKD